MTRTGRQPDSSPIVQDAALSAAMKRDFRRNLLNWYDRHKRDLPWRQRWNDPYAQLLAEFMLQQTQVATVVGYYERFLERFPTLRDLAEARQEEVLALWSGLGYYSRARNLHRAAQQIKQVHGGQVPRDVESLMDLPGIGRYTAGAIASVAYDMRAPVLDGNVSRVLMRWLGLRADPKSREVKDLLWRQAETLLPRKRCGDFNQALMELGATICTPKSPNCLLCPMHDSCQALAMQAVDEIPPARKRVKVSEMIMVTAAIRCDGRLLFVQRPQAGLWAGLWELPSETVDPQETPTTARSRLRSLLPQGCRLAREPRAMITRQLTHRRITFHLFTGTARQPELPARTIHRSARWLSRNELDQIGLSNASRALLAEIEER